MTTASTRLACSAMASSSGRRRTVPVGLWGVFTRIRRVRSVTAPRSASVSSRKPSAVGISGTVVCVAPAIAMLAA